jgi:hypothetical protein
MVFVVVFAAQVYVLPAKRGEDELQGTLYRI